MASPLTELFGFPPSGSISPSVRMLEKDFSFYVPATSFSRAAIIGFASKGPINEPTRVFNHEDLYRQFGYPDPTADHGSYLLYAAIEFLKYGTEAWILRVGVTDESDWTSFAKTSYVEVYAQGVAPVITAGKAENGSTTIDIEAGVNDKFRFSVNGSLYNRLLTIPAGTYSMTSSGTSTMNLVDAFNALLLDGDGVEAFVNTINSLEYLAFRTTKRFGSTALLKIVSTENAIYDAIDLATASTVGETIADNTVWPLGSSSTALDFSEYHGKNPTLRVRVNGTGNTAIDNIVQTIPFDDLTALYSSSTSINTLGIGGNALTTEDVARYINWFIDNPSAHSYTVPGGFRARVTGGKLSLFTATNHSTVTTTDGINSRTLGAEQYNETFITGANAMVQVKFDSNYIDEALGFSNEGKFGVTFTHANTDTFIDPTGAAIPEALTGSDGSTSAPDTLFAIGSLFGRNYAAGTAPIIMTVWADSPGLAGNNTQVVVVVDADGLIQLQVYNKGNYVEGHSKLNLDYTTTNNPYYIEQWVNNVSDYIYVEHNTSTIGLPAEGTYALGLTVATQGSDGYPYDSEGLPDPTAIDHLVAGNEAYGTGLFALAEPEKIDIDLVAAPALNSTSVMSSLIELCEIYRRDCMAIIDSPARMNSVDVRKWHNGEHPLNTRMLNSNFAALYWPWVKILDPFNGVEIWVPPTGSILGVYANSERAENAWAAPAGSRRGTIPSVREVETYAYLKERDALYGNNNAVNTIIPFPVEGPTVWGQKTLQRRSSALDRVNVRRLMLYMEKTVRARVRGLIFEPHDEILRETFIRIAGRVLNQIKVGRGVYDYIIKCDTELNTTDVIDRNEMRARIGVQPTKTAEFIFIEFTIHRTGSFEMSDL